MRAVVLCLLMGCTAAADITENTCGNGVLEGVEDCEGVDNPFCFQCHIRCTPPAFDVPPAVCGSQPDGACCPQDMACGVDFVCHKASGEFEQHVVNASFGGLEFQIGQADEDGIGDVIAVRNGKIEMLFGDTSEPFVRTTARGTPPADALPTFGDITSDGLTDVVIPTAGGLFTFENRFGSSAPGVFPFLSQTDTEFLRVGSLGDGGATRLEHTGTRFQLEATLAPSGVTATKTPCGMAIVPMSLAGRGLPAFHQGANYWIPLLHQTGARLELCVETAQTALPQTAKLLDPAFTFTKKGELLWGIFELTDPACLDIAMPVHDATDTTLIWQGVASGGSCTWSSVNQRVLGGVPLASVHRPPLNNVARTDLLVTSKGIYDATGTLMLVAPHEWTVGAAGDFDHDGLTDFAVANALGEDIEVYEQRDNDTWRMVRIPFTGNVVDLASGDIDGDGFDDIVIAATSGLSDGSVYLAFGGATTIGDPQFALTASRYLALATAPLLDPSLPFLLDVYSDVIIAAGFALQGEDPRPPGTVSYLYGSSNRELSAPYLPPTRYQAFGAIATRSNVMGLFHGSTPCGLQTPVVDDALLLARVAPAFEERHALDICPINKYDLARMRFANIPQGDRDLIFGVSPLASNIINNIKTDECSVWAWSDGTTFASTSCDKLTSNALPGSPARLALEQMVNAKFRTTADGTTVTVIGKTAAASAMMGDQLDAFEWRLSIGTPPVLMDPLSLTERVRAADSDVPIDFCYDVAFGELGVANTKAGVVGAGPDELIVCHYKLDKDFQGSRLYARYVGPTDELILPLGLDIGNAFGDVELGDVNGDALDDIVVRDVVTGSVLLFEQCDHSCGKTGIPEGEGTKQ